MPWQPPSLSVTWPSYFRPTPEDQKALGDTVRDDLDANLITLKTAVEKRADFYGIEDVEAYVAELEQAKADKMAEMHDAMAAMGAGADNDDDDPDGDDDGDQGQKDPPKVGAPVPPKPGGNAPRGGKAAPGAPGNGGARRRKGRGKRPPKGDRGGPAAPRRG